MGFTGDEKKENKEIIEVLIVERAREIIYDY